jgi:hypothetical protein
VASIRRRGESIRLELHSDERLVLAGLAREVRALLQPASDDPVDPLVALTGIAPSAPDPPDDPAVRRLLPDAYDDPSASAEFRRLTDSDLRRGKTDRLSALVDDLDGGDELELTVEQADSWAQALNDIRLALGVRVGVTDDEGDWRDELGPDDPRLPLVAAYDWLSGVQELILSALL